MSTSNRTCCSLLLAAMLAALAPSAAQGAISLVQTVGTSTATSPATTLTVVVASAVAAGDSVLVTFAMDDTPGTISATDSQGNNYAVDGEGVNANHVRVALLSAHGVTALNPGNTITITHPKQAQRSMAAFEFSGLAPSGTLDRTAIGAGNNTPVDTPLTAPTVQASELLFGVVGTNGPATDGFTPGTDGHGGSYTGLTQAGTTGGSASANYTVNPMYRLATVADTYQATGTLSTDRKWTAVLATYRENLTCGDGTVQSPEDCDLGVANGTAAACCSATCTYKPSGASCGNGSDTDCDNPDTCDGAGACQTNHEPSTAECRPASGDCDVPESCDGAGSCPADSFAAANSPCGDGSDSDCDNPDTCDGSGSCNVNNEPSTTECRPASGDCDLPESCDGAGACPADSFAAAATPCGDGSDTDCDNPDTCDGSGSCNVNNEPSTTECRPASGDCDLPESCDGAGACPTDDFEPAGAACGDDSDTDCTAPDTCDGLGSCDDNDTPYGTPCGEPATACAGQDACDGLGACEDGGFAAADVECRAAAGDCDLPEYCTGSDAACPADDKSTTECRPASGDCDVAESCDGVGNDCPPDGFAQETVECRPSSGATCDPAEHCSGTAADCPADTLGESAVVGLSVRVAHDPESGITTILWNETEPGPFNVYRGSYAVGRAWAYNQGCAFEQAVGPDATDDLVPPSTTLFFYLVSRVEGSCTESSLGQDSEGTEIPGFNLCPSEGSDLDTDTVLDQFDNCPTVPNSDQNDLDSDQHGDACDNCPVDANPDQLDADHNGTGNVCE